MIKIKKAIVEGFGSIIGPTKFKWDRPGLNVIIGRVGAGKTTWLSALTWVLYGKSLKSKNIKMWKHIQPKDYQGVYGEVVFEKEGSIYKVIRCQDYKGKVEGAKGNNRLILLENNKPSKIRDKIPLQAEINRILGYSADLFLNTVMFGQGMKRIIEESGPNKKKVFEEAFESGFIKEGRDNADKELKALRPELLKNQLAFESSKASVDKLKSNISLIRDQQREFKESKESRINSLEEKISKCTSLIKSTHDLIGDFSLKKISKKLDNLKIKISEVNSNAIKDLENSEFRQSNLIDNLELQAERITTQITIKTESFKGLKKKCSSCGAKLSKEKIGLQQAKIKGDISDLKNQRWEILSQVNAQKEVYEDIKNKLSSLNKDKSNLIKLRSKQKSYEANIKVHQASLSKIESLEKNLKEYKNDISIIQQETLVDKLGDLPDKLKALKKEKKNLKITYKALKQDISDLEWIVGDALGNKGLRAYVFDTMLRGLNEKLGYYQQYIGYRVEFNVDLDSANKDIYTLCYVGKEMIEYEDLSGGQKKTVDICTAFAIHDLVSGDKPINVMVFDEVFDGLDAEHIDLVYELIREKSRGKSVFLITHNIELQNSSDKVIRMDLNAQGHTVLKTLSA